MEQVSSYNPRAHMGLTSGKLTVVVVVVTAAVNNSSRQLSTELYTCTFVMKLGHHVKPVYMEIMKYSPHVYQFNTVFTLFTHPMKEFNTDASISSFPCMSLKFSVYNNITFYS